MGLLYNKYKLYLELNNELKDKDGFQSADTCDSLLWTGLSASNPANPANIMAAYNKKTNSFHRRPLSKEGCCGCKSSTISRDMLLGLAYYSFYNKRENICKKVIKRALFNFGKMGEGDRYRINIRLPLFITFCLILYSINPNKYRLLRFIKIFGPVCLSYKVKGYEAHLQVLHILLRKDIIGIGKKERQALAYHCERQPLNPLFLYGNGRKLAALTILEDTTLWPEDRLPTSWDRDTEWLFQRDYGRDWKPALDKKKKEYNGADFLFLYWLIQLRKNK